MQLEDLFAPSDMPVPSGFFVATEACKGISRIYSNPYEMPHVDGIHIRVTAVAGAAVGDDRECVDRKKRSGAGRNGGGEGAVAALSRRVVHSGNSGHDSGAGGAGQFAAGDQRRGDGESHDGIGGGSSQGQLPGLEEMIKLMNRERQNNRLYATLAAADGDVAGGR